MTDGDRAQDDAQPDEPADETPDVERVDDDRPAAPRPNEIRLPRLPRLRPPPGNSGPY